MWFIQPTRTCICIWNYSGSGEDFCADESEDESHEPGSGNESDTPVIPLHLMMKII